MKMPRPIKMLGRNNPDVSKHLLHTDRPDIYTVTSGLFFFFTENKLCELPKISSRRIRMTVCFGSTLDHKHVTGSNGSMSLFSNQTGTSWQFLLPRWTGDESIRGVPYTFYWEKMISHGFTAIKTTTGLLSLSRSLSKRWKDKGILTQRPAPSQKTN